MFQEQNNGYDHLRKYTSGLNHYALVCGLQYERIYGKEICYMKNITSPLFRQFPDSMMAWAGPWLVDVKKSADLLSELYKLDSKAPAVSWIASTHLLDKLAIHLASFLNVTLPDDKVALFRFYDPRVLKNLPEILEKEQCESIVSMVDEWLYKSEGNCYSLKRKLYETI